MRLKLTLQDAGKGTIIEFTPDVSCHNPANGHWIIDISDNEGNEIPLYMHRGMIFLYPYPPKVNEGEVAA